MASVFVQPVRPLISNSIPPAGVALENGPATHCPVMMTQKNNNKKYNYFFIVKKIDKNIETMNK